MSDNYPDRQTSVYVDWNPEVPKCDNCRVRPGVLILKRTHWTGPVLRYTRRSVMCQECVNDEINEESAFINREGEGGLIVIEP